MGSSPRMRGTRFSAHPDSRDLGLIPTYAGNTPGCGLYQPAPRAHPHVCGEHPGAFCGPFIPAGSSPRMRGTRHLDAGHPERQGLIPTYAGNTSPDRVQHRRDRAHPHVCGEHPNRKSGGAGPQGSSPRMRGTHGTDREAHAGPGLIPTYAGNTGMMLRLCGVNRAHPHVCGEHVTLRKDYL